LSSERTTTPLPEALSELIRERGLSLRGLARRADADPAHLSRVIRRHSNKRASPELAVRLALALDLPSDYFAEVRERAVIAEVRGDGELRDRLYDELKRS
jgi:transcriptional regulator with XRE-family HTH domain